MKWLLSITLVLFFACNKDQTPPPPVSDCTTKDFFSEYPSRGFKMGFSTWIYAPTEQAKTNTYGFISQNTDIYSEHIDYKIPWSAWINTTALPAEFTDEIAARLLHKIDAEKLLLSISLLNSDRSDLAEDFDGTIPDYNVLNDQEIEDAYFKHVQYLVNAFQPDYLVIAIEVNELRIKSANKWEEYKLLMGQVKSRIKLEFPNLEISESISLHNLYQPDVPNPEIFIEEIVNYANQLEFVTISYYPFFKGHHSKTEFQQAFDFLHERINRPIAFSETGHIAEDLIVDAFNLNINGSSCEQNAYLETLLTNAQEHNYKFIIWWAHRDFDALWETFPDEVKDVGRLWRDTGLLDENAKEREGFSTWSEVFKY